MRINNSLKSNLIADVENICDVKFGKKTKEYLKICFGITISTYLLIHSKNKKP